MSNMRPRLLPNAPTATKNMPSSRLWKRRLPARDERLPNGRSVLSLRSVKQSELPGRRSVGWSGKKERKSVRKNGSNVIASGGNAREIGSENVAIGTEIGQKIVVTETETATVTEIEIETAETETETELDPEIAHGIIREIDTAGDGVSEPTATDVQKRSRSSCPRRNFLAWKRRLWPIYSAIASVSPLSSLSSRLTRN